MTDTPEHRAGFHARNGDTHEIGEDGELHNVDQAARDRAARDEQSEAETTTAFFAAADAVVAEPSLPVRRGRAASADDADA